MEKNKWLAFVAAACLIIPATQAGATALDFNYLANNLPEGYYYGVNPINTNGFTISAPGNGPWGLGVYGTNSSHQADPGHAAVAVNLPGAITSLVSTDNSLFSFNSIDFADINNEGAGGTIQFTFFHESNNITYQNVTLDALIGLQTFEFSMSDLSKVSWQTIGGSYGMSQFDNISVAAIPEPETYAMLLAGLGLLGFMARCRKTKR